ncbi:DgyrCDS4623 [Dimorphilus gyrociliatus]|uniref:DgyrCDS4623 n=1 Tax=Dimorphilus gyrociliatus TaxID=2664684 RepID=A0A7I8VH46_9ANNE|nr:DgyrCDS4623 [Dimorphilus gyrociliatus]
MKIILIFILVSTCSCRDYSKFPKNTAVFNGQPARLNCTAIDEVRIYDETSWIYTQSQWLITYRIALNLTINPFQSSKYEFADNSTYSLNIQSVNQDTAGVYECSGSYGGNKVDNFHAFVLSMESEPSCEEQIESLPDNLPSNLKIVYCFIEYASFYPPSINITSSGKIYNVLSETRVIFDGSYHTGGACALIDRSESFSCSVKFGSPPPELLLDISYDDSAPDIQASCSNSSGRNLTIPPWILDGCQNIYEPLKPQVINIPKNTAVTRGSSANMTCTSRNFGSFGLVQWFYRQSESDQAVTISVNNIIYPSAQGLIELYDTYNLNVLSVDQVTTGLFQCTASDENFYAVHEAFLLEMEKSSICITKRYAELDDLVTPRKAAFCLTNYTGSYHPTASIMANGNLKETFTFEVNNTVGACAAILISERINCSMKFGTPPDNLILFEITDNSAPDLVTYCDEEIVDTEEDNLFPKWLEEKCAEALFPKPQELLRKPENVAVARGSTNVTMHCSTANFRNYDYNSWRFSAEPGGTQDIITGVDFVLIGFEHLYGIEGTWDLVVKEVNDKTTGIYECEVRADAESGNIEGNFMAFLLEMESEPLCAEDPYDGVVPDYLKVVFCLTNYTGAYAPQVSITAENGIEISAKVLNGSQVGSCAVIKKEDEYNCTVKFGTPPTDLTLFGDFDTSAPNYTTSCSSKNSINIANKIPRWLEEQCINNYGEPRVIKRPVNTAAFTGEKAQLDCTTKSFNQYGGVFWSIKPENGNIIPLSFQDIISPNYPDQYSIQDKWNLIINSVNKETTGLYECYASDLGVDVFYDVHLLEMAKTPSCLEIPYNDAPGMKLAFCMTNYSGAYFPNFNLTFSGDVQSGKVFVKDGQAGTCAVIKETMAFDCTVKFGSPPFTPGNENLDYSAPNLTAHCSGGSSPQQIPPWLMDDCLSNQQMTTPEPKPPQIIRLATNTAVLRNQFVTLPCTTRNFPSNGFVIWSFISPVFDGLGIISIKDEIMTNVPKDRYAINDTWSLDISKVNVNTTGLYDYYIMDGVDKNIYKYIFLSELEEKPKCITSSHDNLPTTKQFVYCTSDYSGFYPPGANITVDGDIVSFVSSQKNGKVGSCGIIDKGKPFLCQVKFDSPPVIHPNFPIDMTAPSLTTECSENSGSIGDGKEDYLPFVKSSKNNLEDIK